MSLQLFVHDINRCSFVNGPGARAVVWVQGCSLGCPGCFNPGTHRAEHPSASIADPAAMGEELGRLPVDGLTLSGGEPLEQPEAVSELIRAFRRWNSGTVLIFSGFSPKRIFASAAARSTLLLADAVLAGPYKEEAGSSEIWSSKQLILVTDRIEPNTLTPERRLEVSLHTDSSVRLSGYPDPAQRRDLQHYLKQEPEYDQR
ncbi:4Fe-4S single cluster domain-containing protein [Paenibacillus vini]|uniref:Radical SAM protein n=1 Tax=Paenibacillus vini TaxID=1476024 RepID=A0ABQ4M5L9_9BACL|nr:4Fe-4S single cluster domain-containing protein [Paenibacillus vini]GIP51303.1 radical SAM protein [Paenibacillus vini]